MKSVPGTLKMFNKGKLLFLLCIILPFNCKCLNGKTLHLRIFVFSIVQCMALSRCSVNSSFNGAGKSLCPGKTKNRFQSQNAINIKEEIALSLLSHVLYSPHFTVTCFNVTCATGTAIRSPETSYMVDSSTCRSHFTAGHFLFLESLFSFYFACTILHGFSNLTDFCSSGPFVGSSFSPWL